jgi:CheY-like chemotaxis protein
VSDVRVLVVDDYADFRRAAAAMVDAMPGFHVTATAATAEDGIALAAQVDLVLLDVSLPGMSGIEAASAISKFPQPPLVILVSTYGPDGFDAADYGAAAYVAKPDLDPSALIEVWTAAHPP